MRVVREQCSEPAVPETLIQDAKNGMGIKKPTLSVQHRKRLGE
jgi:hypothetical protein